MDLAVNMSSQIKVLTYQLVLSVVCVIKVFISIIIDVLCGDLGAQKIGAQNRYTDVNYQMYNV